MPLQHVSTVSCSRFGKFGSIPCMTSFSVFILGNGLEKTWRSVLSKCKDWRFFISCMALLSPGIRQLMTVSFRGVFGSPARTSPDTSTLIKVNSRIFLKCFNSEKISSSCTVMRTTFVDIIPQYQYDNRLIGGTFSVGYLARVSPSITIGFPFFT